MVRMHVIGDPESGLVCPRQALRLSRLLSRWHSILSISQRGPALGTFSRCGCAHMVCYCISVVEQLPSLNAARVIIFEVLKLKWHLEGS